MYNWYRFFSRVCSTDSSSCSERKNWKKTRLKQGSKTKEGNQNVVVVANSPDSSSLNCQTAIAPLLLRYLPNIATLSLCCRSAVTTLSHRYCSAVATPLLLRCRAPVTPLSHRYPSTVTPLLSLLLSIRSRTAISPLSRRCLTATAPSQL